MTKLELPSFIAHRGASKVAPENTIVALLRAHALGAKWIEFDVMLTRDDQPIIFHDDTLDRTTNGHGKVVETMSTVVASLDAGSWFGAEFQHEKIPTLKDWLNTAHQCGLGLNLEMKVKGTKQAKILAKHIVSALDACWSNTLPFPLISSFYRPCLEAIQKIAPNLPRALLINRWTSNFERLLDRYECVSLNMNQRYVTPERVAMIKRLGRKFLAYTIDDARRAAQLFDMGVDAIFTNNLDLLKQMNIE